MKLLNTIVSLLLLLLHIQVFSQCNIQASICDIDASPSFNFGSASGGPYAGGAFANAGCTTGAGGQQIYGFITLYISASGSLNLLINGNANTGFIDVAIFKIPNGVAPCVAIQSGSNAIGCNYASQSGGCVQFGNQFSCGSTVPAPYVNAGDVIMIIAQNWSGASGNYTLKLAPNGAEAGLPDASIDLLNTEFCTNNAPSQLTAVNNGGTWSGPDGLSSDGTLNSTIAGAGTHWVYYSIGSGECQAEDSTQITIRSVKITDTSTSNCMPGGFYNFSGTVQIEFPPENGDLIVKNCKGDQVIIASAPFTSTSYSFEFSGMDADGLSCDIDAYFTQGLCGDLILYNAPECLSCVFTNSSIELSNCHADNTFDVSGTIEFDIEPLTGKLIVENCAGESLIFDAPFSIPISYLFKNQSITDDSCFIYAYFTDDICTLKIDYLPHSAPIISTIADSIICLGDTATISAMGGIHYLWNNNLSTAALQKVSPYTTTTYIVTGYDSYECKATDTVRITVNSLPIIDFDVTQDQGCIPVKTIFKNHTTSPSGLKECIWTFDDKSINQNCDSVIKVYNKSGLFGASLWVKSNENCVAELRKDDLLSILPLPQALFRPLPSIYEFSDPLVYFSNFSTGASSYIWNFGINDDTTHIVAPYYAYPNTKEGIYTVSLIAFSEDGCSDTTQHTVRGEEGLIFYIPNTFTPQGDGFNETFRPILTSGFDFIDYSFSVIDRWGKIIFETNDIYRGWDGLHTNSITQNNSYTWRIELTAKRNNQRKVYTGHVNLIR